MYRNMGYVLPTPFALFITLYETRGNGSYVLGRVTYTLV